MDWRLPSLLAAGTASGLCQVDVLWERWFKDKPPYGGSEGIRMEDVHGCGLLSCVCALQIFLVYTPLGCIFKLESILYCHLRHRHTTVKLLFDSHSSQTTYNNLNTHKRH